MMHQVNIPYFHTFQLDDCHTDTFMITGFTVITWMRRLVTIATTHYSLTITNKLVYYADAGSIIVLA